MNIVLVTYYSLAERGLYSPQLLLSRLTGAAPVDWTGGETRAHNVVTRDVPTLLNLVLECLPRREKIDPSHAQVNNALYARTCTATLRGAASRLWMESGYHNCIQFFLAKNPNMKK